MGMSLEEVLAEAKRKKRQEINKQKREEIEKEAAKARQGLTPREIESRKLENIEKTKQIMSLWSVYKTPSYKRKFASVEELQARIAHYLSAWENANMAEVFPPTVEELATELGYSTVRGLMLAIKNNSENEIGELLSFAVEQVKSLITMKMMTIAEAKGDYKAFAYLLDGINNSINSMMLESTQELSKKDEEKAKADRELQLRSANAINDIIAKFTAEAIEDGVNAVTEIEVEDEQSYTEEDEQEDLYKDEI